MDAKEILIRSLDDAFHRHGWHGTTLKGSLRGLDPETLLWKPSDERHSIWELAVHAAYWKYAVRRRLTGEEKSSFPLEGSNWFVPPVSLTVTEWRKTVRMLQDEHDKLVDAVRALPESRLGETIGKYQVATLIYGVAAHDAYHTGQIQLLKRLHAESVA